MIIPYKKIIKWIGYLAAALIILLSLVISITRMLTPYFNHHLPDFEAYVNKTFQRKITIGHVHLAWSIYEPELVFTQVKIVDKRTEKPAISIRKIKLNFGILRSLLARQPMIDSLKISGVQFTVEEQAKGEFNIGDFGFSMSDSLTGASVQANEMLDWICSQPRLLLRDININFINLAGDHHSIILDNIQLKNSGDDHSLHGQAIFQQEAPTSTGIDIQWHGQVEHLASASATIFLYFEGLSFPERLKKLNWHGWQITQGLGSAKIWATWKNNAFQSIQSKFQMYDLTLISLEMHQSRTITRFSGNANWRREGVNQVIEGQDILIDLPDRLLPTTDFSVTLASGKDNQRAVKEVKMSYISLVDVVNFLKLSHILSDDTNDVLKKLNPQGGIKNLSINLPLDSENKLKNTVIEADLDKVAFDSWDAYPAVKNLTGKVNWDGKQGGLQLHSTDLSVTYSKLFQNPLHFDTAIGRMTLSTAENNLQTVSVNSLQLTNKDINLRSAIEIKLNLTSSPIIDATTDFTVFNVGHISQYFPMNIMNADLNSWLKQAFISGQLNGGRAIIQGNLKDYPFEGNQGKFLISAKVKNLEFRFAPIWPVMHQLNGDLTFAGSTMTANVNSGLIGDVPIKKAHATMNNIGTSGPTILLVQGLVQSDWVKGLYFIHHSPLEVGIGKDLSQITLKGPLELNLDLTVPIAKPENASAKGKINTSNATLSISEWNLALEKITGLFQFTEDEIVANHISCRLLGENADFTLSTQQSPDKKKFVRANLQSHAEVSALQKWLDIPLEKIIKGGAAYQAELDIAPHDSSMPTHITFQSNLKGIAFNAPAPYGKPADTESHFKLEIFATPNQPLINKIYYGNLISSALILNRQNQKLQLIGGDIHLGSGEPNESNVSGVTISGQMDYFDWDIWKNYVGSLGIKPTENKSDKIWGSIDVQMNKLTAFNQSLNQVRVQLSQPTSQTVRIGLTNADMQGNVTFTISNLSAGIQVKFDRLYFSSAIKSSVSQINPKTIPPISFIGNDIRIGDRKLGQLTFNTFPSSSGLVIDNLTMKSSVARLSAKGEWEFIKKNYQTHFQGNLDMDHVSRFLTEWGLDESNLISNKGNIKFDLDWPDSPYNPDPGEMSGEIALKLGEGQIINLSSSDNAKLGLGRMLNILSLQTLPRRLNLNFSDLTQKGYTFDYITANFTLNGGSAYTKDMIVNGTVARVDVSGRIGLEAKDYDLAVSITPYVTSSLPLVATIATGFNPIAGVATFLVDKVVSQGVSNVTTYHYHVTGPWSKPVWQEGGLKK